MRFARSAFALSAFVLAVSTQGALAQINLTSSPNPPSSFADQTIKVTTSFRTPLSPAADAQTPPDAKAQEAARRELYRMAENECAALLEIYKAECHLISVTINQSFPLPASAVPPNALNATAVYELRRSRTAP